MVTDRELMERWVTGREAGAFEELVRRHVGMVYGAARRMLGGPGAEAEDVVQGVFWLLAQRAGRGGVSGEKLGGWLYRVTVYACRNVRREEGRRKKREREVGMLRGEAVMEEGTREAMLGVLDEGMMKLSERERRAVVARYLEGKSAEEAGAELGVSAMAAEKRARRGVERLRKFFGGRGVGVGVGAVVGVMGAEAVRAAPVSVVSAAVGAGAGKVSVTGVALAKGAAMSMVRAVVMRGAVGVAAIGAVVAGGVWAAGAGGPAARRADGTVQAAAPMEAPVTTEPAGDVDPITLVFQARGRETWIMDASSFHVVAKETSTLNAEELANRRADYVKFHPGQPVDEKEVAAQGTEKVEEAFDRKRWYIRSTDSQRDLMNLWDGTREVGHGQYASGQNSYSIGPETNDFSTMWRGWFAWPRSWEGMPMWFDQPRKQGDPIYMDLPERFVALWKQPVDGVECDVVAETTKGIVYYIGVADHRLRKMTQGRMAGNPAWLDFMKEEAVKRGVTVTDIAGAYKWAGTLTRSERTALDDEALRRTALTDKPLFEHLTGDYRELSPHCWYPMKQSVVLRDYRGTVNGPKAGEEADQFAHPAEIRREIELTTVEVNKPLPEELFKAAFQEGVEVYDETQDPPLRYRYKQNMTEEEWAQIRADAMVEKNRVEADKAKLAKVKAAQDALIGKPAPAFDAGGLWLNGSALDWGKLKGQVVVLDFFAEWCGPCRNDFPVAEGAFEREGETGVKVIGVHVAGSKRTDIEKLLKDFKMIYPVYVDVAPGAGGALGKVVDQYGVKYLPQAVLVDGEGKIVGHGTLAEMLEKAGGMKGK